MGRPLYLILPALLTVAGAARADEPNVCEEPHAIDRYQLLRRLSLDLRGKLPAIEEYDALDALEAVPDVTIQQYIESDDFRLTMRRYHEAMFWPNIASTKLHNTNAVLSNTSPANPDTKYAYRIVSAGRAKGFRGASDEWCGDFQQTHFDPKYPGELRPDPAFVQTDPVTGMKQEGWRMVAPYWDPANPIPVCAFDAQETVSDTIKGNVEECNTPAGNASANCGCGANLRYCYSPGGVVDNAVKAAMREQLGLSVDQVTAAGRPYTDLLLSNRAFENGVLAYWKKYASTNGSTSTAWVTPDPKEPIPDLDYVDTTWKEVDLGAMHAGVLSLPGYLLRFQTNRGRANRFRINFLCEYFIPPDQLDPQPGCSPDSNDLTQRCNCQYCHQTLEPLAAHFAGFAEAGSTLMTDQSVFPTVNPACVKTNPTAMCSRFYVTQSDAHNPGSLLAWQYADVHPEYQTSIQDGPIPLAQSIIDDGSFASCTVKKLFTFLMKRDPELDGSAFDEQATIDDLAKKFKDGGYDIRLLVQDIVSLRQYRRAR